MDQFSFQITRAGDLRDSITDFYQACERPIIFDDENIFVLVVLKNKMIGAVRLCHEHGHFVLRTMQIHPDFQKQGIGQKLLHQFEQLLIERQIHSIYCMPFAHLEKFYASIGFKKIETAQAPGFLQQRLFDMHKRDTRHHGILMFRAH